MRTFELGGIGLESVLGSCSEYVVGMGGLGKEVVVKRVGWELENLLILLLFVFSELYVSFGSYFREFIGSCRVGMRSRISCDCF